MVANIQQSTKLNRITLSNPKGNTETESDISLERLQEIIATKRPVFIKIGADWCGHCRMLDDLLKRIVPSNKEIMFVKIDSDNPGNTQIIDYLKQASGEDINWIPVIISFKDGKLYTREKSGFTERRVNELIARLKT